MQNCIHLNVQPPQQVTPHLTAPAIALCSLKTDAPTRIAMAQNATKILGIYCPPNTECHYYNLNRCEDCPDYAT
jgi:hypothetical protein